MWHVHALYACGLFSPFFATNQFILQLICIDPFCSSYFIAMKKDLLSTKIDNIRYHLHYADIEPSSYWSEKVGFIAFFLENPKENGELRKKQFSHCWSCWYSEWVANSLGCYIMGFDEFNFCGTVRMKVFLVFQKICFDWHHLLGRNYLKNS